MALYDSLPLGLSGYPLLGLILLFTLIPILLHKLYGLLAKKQRPTSFLKSGSRPGSGTDLKTQFPPSSRQALLSTPNPVSTAKEYQKLLGATPADVAVQSYQLPSTLPSSSLTESHPYFTPTGFSTADIEALGRFPDYSVLSGVPHPTPCPEFDITTACFRPYRPFRWAYHQTMALSKFEPDFWIELEKNYFESLKQRKSLLDEHGSSILNYSPSPVSELACRELMEMVLQNLCIRYPRQFSLEESNTVFVNRLLDTRTDLTARHPLHVLFDNVPEDFAIMMRNEEDGVYHLRAGYICSSIGWTFGTHFGRPLRAIHTEVNDYDKMAKSMDKFFAKLPTNTPIQRGAWFIEDWKPLFVTPEEYALNAGTRYSDSNKPISIDQCYLRVDWQTLRRLPLSGAIVFNFKAIFTPMTELRGEPYIPALLYKQVTEGKKLITEPKVHKHLLGVVLGALQEWKREQVGRGVVEKGWEEATLAESPFYPGWEEVWRDRGGLGFNTGV